MQDGIHKATDPGKVLGRADGPDEVYAASSYSACVGGSEKITDMHQMVGYACTAREKNNGAIAAKGRRVGGIRALNESGCFQREIWRRQRGIVQFAGHSGTRGHDEGDAGWLGIVCGERSVSGMTLFEIRRGG